MHKYHKCKNRGDLPHPNQKRGQQTIAVEPMNVRLNYESQYTPEEETRIE